MNEGSIWHFYSSRNVFTVGGAAVEQTHPAHRASAEFRIRREKRGRRASCSTDAVVRWDSCL